MTTNYNITDTIASVFQERGYSVKSDASKASDYLYISSPEMFDTVVVRLSSHNAIAGRSQCAHVDFEIPSIYDEMYGNYISYLIEEDNDIFIDPDGVEFDTKEERDDHVMSLMLKEIEKSIQKFK